jgi:YidC/Oxa1 family membrane protein insertase
MSLNPLYAAAAWLLLRWHDLISWLGLGASSGLGWTVSIVALVITVRLVLLRPTLVAARHQDRLQQLQPQLAAIRRKYAHDPSRRQRELLAVQQKAGINPLAGCLPALIQIPIFVAMLHVLRHLAHVAGATAGAGLTLYGFSRAEAISGADAQLFGAPLAGSVHDGAHRIVNVLGGSMPATITVTVVLIVLSALATIGTQLIARRRVARDQPDRPSGTTALVQRAMLVAAPVSVVVSGLLFPLGIVIYWWASNTWTFIQQLLIHHVV